MTRRQREDVACYLIDRADQYDTESPCWVALADAAKAVMRGEVEEAVSHGELDDDDIRRRVRRWAPADVRCSSTPGEGWNGDPR